MPPRRQRRNQGGDVALLFGCWCRCHPRTGRLDVGADVCRLRLRKTRAWRTRQRHVRPRSAARSAQRSRPQRSRSTVQAIGRLFPGAFRQVPVHRMVSMAVADGNYAALDLRRPILAPAFGRAPACPRRCQAWICPSAPSSIRRGHGISATTRLQLNLAGWPGSAGSVAGGLTSGVAALRRASASPNRIHGSGEPWKEPIRSGSAPRPRAAR